MILPWKFWNERHLWDADILCILVEQASADIEGKVSSFIGGLWVLPIGYIGGHESAILPADEQKCEWNCMSVDDVCHEIIKYLMLYQERELSELSKNSIL